MSNKGHQHNQQRQNVLGAANPREDERLVQDPATDARGSRAAQDSQRASDEGTSMTLEQRRAMLRNEAIQEALPRVPEIPGWHFCWLSTSNSYDPIHKRMRLGYVPVRTDELPGFSATRMTSGEFDGCISCNEMILFKIPREIYEMIMSEFHHEMPLQEEEALRRQLVRDEEDRAGKKLGQITEDSDGFDDLGKRVAGSFA